LIVIRALSPPLSRVTLVLVIAAHAVAGSLAIVWSVRHRPSEPVPLMVTLMSAPEPDVLPVPLPTAPEPVAKPEPPHEVAPRPVQKTTVAEPLPAPVPEQKQIKPEPPIESPPMELPTPMADVPAPPVPVPPLAAVAAPSVDVPPVPQVAARPDPPKSLVDPAPAPATAQPADTEAAPQAWNADYLRNPKPAYPNSSRRLGEHGTVLLRVLVTAVGEAAKVELKSTSGYRRLDDSALEAVRQWKFVPARLGERPVDAWVVVPIKFSLKG